MQICVAPDYILIPRSSQDEFLAALKKHYTAFYPNGALASSSYGRIVSSAHWNRLKSLLDRTASEIVIGGGVDDKNGIEPTVVKNVKEGDSLMEEYVISLVALKFMLKLGHLLEGRFSDHFSQLCLLIVSRMPSTL